MSNEPKLIGREFLHSCKFYLKNNAGSAVSVSEYLHYDNGIRVPNVRYFKNAPRPFYITKPEFRTHPEKKEFEELSKLDRYMAPDKDLNASICQILSGNNRAPKYPNPDIIKTSPYVYLADQDIQVFIKHNYRKLFEQSGIKAAPASTGFFDTEKDIDTDEFTVMSATHENKLYTGINRKYCKLADGTPVTEADLLEMYNKFIIPIIEKEVEAHPKIKRSGKFPIIPEFKICDNELEMTQWVFSKIHENKTAFIGIWNINYDMRELLKLLQKEGIPPEELLVHPDVPAEYRHAQYHYDEQTAKSKKNPHISDFWHWEATSGYTQYIDSMLLFAKNRKAATKEPSYSLDSILKKFGFGGKLKFDHLAHLNNVSSTDWHRFMSRDHFPEYVLYNQVDVLALQLLEWLNTDISTMNVLSENTPIAKFSKETRKLVTDYATRWIDRGYALGCARKDMTNSWDKYYPAVGGAVLSPNRIVDIGLKPFKDYPTLETRLHAFVNDVDFKAIYPTVVVTFNISKDTKRFTVIRIEGDWVKYKGYDSVEVFFAGIRNQREEALRIARDYYNEPGFIEMEELVRQRLAA